MLQTLFYIGVLTPAAIVVFLFIIFLICWFKCNLRERIYQKIGRGHNSTQSSLADTKDYMNGKMQPQIAIHQEHLDNEDNESRCGSVRIINGQVVKYNRGEFPYMKRESWRYMSTKSVSKIRQEILQEKVFPPLPPIWTTTADSSSSLDSETAMTKPWLPQEGKGQGHEEPQRESQLWNNNRHCSWNPSQLQCLSVDNSTVNIKQHGQIADLPQSSSDTSDSLGTSPAIHRENTAVRPLYFSQTPIQTQSMIHASPKRNYNYNQKTLNEKIPDKSYELFLADPLKESRVTITANTNGCQKQLLLDSQDLGTSTDMTDVDNIYLSVMPNVRAPIVSV